MVLVLWIFCGSLALGYHHRRMPRPRSRAYPVQDLASCLDDMKLVLRKLGKGGFERELLAEALGYLSADGGLAARKVAAATQFGLLRRKDGRYRPTPLAERILHPATAEEHRTALLEAVEAPPLHGEVIERFRSQGRLPEELASFLFRDFGITTAAAPKAARVLLRSAVQGGLTDEQGRFVGIQPGHEPPELVLPRKGGGSGANPPDGPPDGQLLEVRLTGGKTAVFRLPGDLSEADLAILEKQFEILRLQRGG
jgi:hypothetical protein